MRQPSDLIAGMLLGAGAMYLLDPDRGRRRRHLVRDQLVHGMHRMEDAVTASTRDLQNRARGAAAGARGKLSAVPVDDPVLEARVRARLGRVVSSPGSIEVVADHGLVTLHGAVLQEEVEPLLSTVASVAGVEEVRNRLEVHESAAGVPALQGGRRRRGERFELLQDRWAPGTRLLMGIAGTALLSAAARRGGLLGGIAGAGALAVLSRSVSNLDLASLVGIGGERGGAIEAHKTITVRAPVEEVFAFWSRFENFPRFMSHLIEVSRIGEGRSHWVARGPGSLPVEWDAVTTELVPNETIAWRSIDGSVVENSGRVRFLPVEGGTRVDVHMRYTPPAGAIGHLVAALFGRDPRHAMNDDLVRFKSLVENGKTSAEGKTVRREEV